MTIDTVSRVIRAINTGVCRYTIFTTMIFISSRLANCTASLDSRSVRYSTVGNGDHILLAGTLTPRDLNLWPKYFTISASAMY